MVEQERSAPHGDGTWIYPQFGFSVFAVDERTIALSRNRCEEARFTPLQTNWGIYLFNPAGEATMAEASLNYAR